jgi:hypothetical protein
LRWSIHFNWYFDSAKLDYQLNCIYKSNLKSDRNRDFGGKIFKYCTVYF